MAKLNYNKAEFKSSYGISSQLPNSDRFEFVFSGRSNVGKSSLINKLCNRKNLARVSATPGKTATINYYDIQNIYFVDLPGYGYAKVSNSERQRWDNLINSYFEANRNQSLLFQLLDCRRDAPSKEDFVMLEYLLHFHVPFFVVLTKSDKIKKAEHQKVIDKFAEICKPYGCKGVMLTSTSNALGIEELQAKIQSYIDEEVIINE